MPDNSSQVGIWIRRPLCLAWGGGAREAWSMDCLPASSRATVAGQLQWQHRIFSQPVHGARSTSACQLVASPHTLSTPYRFCFAFSGFEAAVRHHVRERIRDPLGLNPAGVPLFRNHALGGVSAAESRVLLRATAKASTPFHTHPSIHPSLFAFSYPRCCYGPRPKLPPDSTPIHPSIHLSLFAFSWFEGAETALGPQTNWPPLGRESCWGSAVSQPCPRRCFCSRIHGVVLLRAAAKASTFHPIPLPSIHPSIHPSISLLL